MLTTRTLGPRGLTVSSLGLGLLAPDKIAGPRYNEKQMSMVDL